MLCSKMLLSRMYFFYPVFLQFISLGFLLFQVVVSQIPLGSKLSIEENNLWVSPSGDFALGFYNHSDLPNRFSIGIRFNSKTIPPDKQTVVWVAGADVTVSNNSYFELTPSGNIVLFDSSLGVPAWSSRTSRLSVATALLRDDGNLFLLNKNNKIMWQSFDTPADTLLPGQIFSQFVMLRAASKNSMSSYYNLQMDDSGRLELKWESNITFWRSDSETLTGKNISAVLTSEGALFLRDQDKQPIWSAFGEDHNDTVKFRFLRLDVDGNLRMYSWNEVLGTWKSVWQAIENQCNVFATCGRQVCSFNDFGYAECKCPFDFASESNPKCLVPYQKQGCKSGSVMVELKHTYLYGIYPANDSVYQTSLEKCKTKCADDPSCTSATYMNDGSAWCRMKLTQYVSGYSDPSLSSSSFVKKCSDPLAVDPNNGKSAPPPSLVRSFNIRVPCLLWAASGASVLFLGIQLGIALLIYRKRKRVKKKGALSSRGTNPNGLIILSLDEIKDITENFKHNIGPRLFKGVLPERQPVAIKEMEATLEERKFRSAASKIGSIHHRNLLKLEAYCCELGQRYLVYEYAKNGLLDKYIEDSAKSKKLSWRKRLEICLSVAKALCYLHTECREFMSHGNLRCENVGLDENFEAKLMEFGFGLCSADKDIKDFGNMVLTLITGSCDAEQKYEWAYREWIEGRNENIIDKRINGGFDLDELERLLRIAFWCVQIDERLKPSMGEVVKVLEGALSVDPPPLPFAFGRSSPSDSLESRASEP